jgi:predicted dithiol-disulfide oxidoreductase (DUF899 family)
MTDFATANKELRVAELDLMLQRERVAELRRTLPMGPVITDYLYDSADGPVRLSELASAPDRPVVLYHFMYGGQQQSACPMCSMWTDGWNALAHHVRENIDFALISDAPLDQTLALAEERGWTNLRWLSAADNDFKVEIGGADTEGNQWPFMSAYEMCDGAPRLTWSGGAHIEGDHWRGVDLFSPVWHFLDLTRQGRQNWMPSLDYTQ